MNIIKKLLYIIPAAGMLSVSCTKVEKTEVDHIGGYNTMDNAESRAYYENIRAYKKTGENHQRPVAFGWFSDWNPLGTQRRGYLSSMPDSIDIVSMWSGAPDRNSITPEQKADKEFVQKVKGTKLLEVSLISHLGKGRTPESIYESLYKQAEEEGWSDDKLSEQKKFARWDFWGFKSHNLSNTEELDAAMATYAKALCDTLFTSEWDGFDIDWELGSGTNDHDGTLDDRTIVVLIKEMGKYIGPASDPEGNGHKLLCVDGGIYSLMSQVDEYVDYWISQNYGSNYFDFSWYKAAPEKIIITENFEAYALTGGNLLEQAAIMPETGFKGGVGAYRFQKDYDNAPDYKYMRRAIQINQEVFHEWQNRQESGETGDNDSK